MPEDAPPPGTPCIVMDCGAAATLYVRVGEPLEMDAPSNIAMCDDHAAHWRDGDLS